KGRYLLLLNSDTIVLDNAISKTMQFMEKNPTYGVGSCKILNADRSLQPNCSMQPSLTNLALLVSGLPKVLPQNRFLGRAEMTWWNYSEERSVEVLKGCFMMVRRKAFEDTGEMDPNYFMYSEEVDWCNRFILAGWKLGFFPN